MILRRLQRQRQARKEANAATAAAAVASFQEEEEEEEEAPDDDKTATAATPSSSSLLSLADKNNNNNNNHHKDVVVAVTTTTAAAPSTPDTQVSNNYLDDCRQDDDNDNDDNDNDDALIQWETWQHNNNNNNKKESSKTLPTATTKDPSGCIVVPLPNKIKNHHYYHDGLYPKSTTSTTTRRSFGFLRSKNRKQQQQRQQQQQESNDNNCIPLPAKRGAAPTEEESSSSTAAFASSCLLAAGPACSTQTKKTKTKTKLSTFLMDKLGRMGGGSSSNSSNSSKDGNDVENRSTVRIIPEVDGLPPEQDQRQGSRSNCRSTDLSLLPEQQQQQGQGQEMIWTDFRRMEVQHVFRQAEQQQRAAAQEQEDALPPPAAAAAMAEITTNLAAVSLVDLTEHSSLGTSNSHVASNGTMEDAAPKATAEPAAKTTAGQAKAPQAVMDNAKAGIDTKDDAGVKKKAKQETQDDKVQIAALVASAKEAATKAKQEAREKKTAAKKAAKQQQAAAKKEARKNAKRERAMRGKGPKTVIDSECAADQEQDASSANEEYLLSEKSILITALNGEHIPVGSDPPVNDMVVGTEKPLQALGADFQIKSTSGSPFDSALLNEQKAKIMSRVEPSSESFDNHTVEMPRITLARPRSSPPTTPGKERGGSFPKTTSSPSRSVASNRSEAKWRGKTPLATKISKQPTKPKHERASKVAKPVADQAEPNRRHTGHQQLHRELLLKVLEYRERKLEDLDRESHLVLAGKPDIKLRPVSTIAGRDFPASPCTVESNSLMESTLGSLVSRGAAQSDGSTLSTQPKDLSSAIKKTTANLGAIGKLVSEEAMHMISRATSASEDESRKFIASRSVGSDALDPSSDGKETHQAKTTVANEPGKPPRYSKNTPEDKSASVATSRSSISHQPTSGSLMDAGSFFGISTDAASLAAESNCSTSFDEDYEGDQLSDAFDDDSLAMVWEMGTTPIRKSRTEPSNPLELAKTMASQIVSVFSGDDYVDDASSGCEDGNLTDYLSGEDSSYDSRSTRSFKSFTKRLRRLRENGREEGGAVSPDLISPPSMGHTANDTRQGGSNASSSLVPPRYFGARHEEKKDDDQDRTSSVRPDLVQEPSDDCSTKKCPEKSMDDATTEIARSFSQEIVLTLSNSEDGGSLYKRKIKLNSSNPKECEKVITQEIFVALSEDNSVSSSGEKRRTFKAEFVANDGTPQEETLESRSAGSESAFASQPSQNDSLLVEFDHEGGVASTACHSFSAFFCNAF